jgi:uncharacterized protein
MLPAYAMPLHGLIGGLMIGSAAAIMLLGLGRIAGVSGLAARSLGLADGPPWSLAASFIVGLPLGAWLVQLIAGPITLRFAPAAGMLVLGGLLVGFGTRLGGGCTSGHGVCGLSRLSPRSLTATATFIASGVVAVALVNRIGLGW